MDSDSALDSAGALALGLTLATIALLAWPLSAGREVSSSEAGARVAVSAGAGGGAARVEHHLARARQREIELGVRFLASASQGTRAKGDALTPWQRYAQVLLSANEAREYGVIDEVFSSRKVKPELAAAAAGGS